MTSSLSRNRLQSKLPIVVGGASLAALLVWLGVSSNPTEIRIRRLNELIEGGQLGKVDETLQRRLTLQFEWLARHAGAKSPIVVNGPIRPHQLTLVVTKPAFESVTHCGSGNAVFDPSLNTIFIDSALVWPFEANVVGTRSVNTMFSPSQLGYVKSYTSFIIAHELGHWQAHNKEAAFFYYGWNDGSASLADEQAADRSAMRTLFAAGIADDEPSELRSSNALSSVGLGSTSLSPRDRVMADALGGILMMSYDLLFASSPFSPYYSDRSHPDLLSRVQQAARVAEADSTSVASEASLLRSELGRFSALGTWRHREIFLPGPLTIADFRDGSLWIGRTDIPDPIDAGPDKRLKLDEQIYRITLHPSLIREHSSGVFDLPSPVKIGNSRVGEEFNYAENLGAWVENEFEKGDASIGLPSAAITQDPIRERLGGVVRWIGDVAYEDMGWRWPSRGPTPQGALTERDLLTALRLPLTDGKPALGQLQWQAGSIAVPTVKQDQRKAWTFRVFLITNFKPLQLAEQMEFTWTPNAGTIEIGAARIGMEGGGCRCTLIKAVQMNALSFFLFGGALHAHSQASNSLSVRLG